MGRRVTTECGGAAREEDLGWGKTMRSLFDRVRREIAFLVAGRDRVARWSSAAAFAAVATLATGVPASAVDSETAAIETGTVVQETGAEETVVQEPWANDPLKIVVSLQEQRLWLYRGAHLLETTPVSTGRAGHRTPRGVYSVIQKRRRHFSNLYNNAPMPYMQRITWSGIAFHEGVVPRYPASHGCILLPRQFARRLFQLTEMGCGVVIVNGTAEPLEIAHEMLPAFTPYRRFSQDAMIETGLTEGAEGAPLLDDGYSPLMTAVFDIELDAHREPTWSERSRSPIRVLITRRSTRQRTREAQRLLDELGYEVGVVDGLFGSQTASAIRAFQTAQNLDATGAISDELISALYAAAGEPETVGQLFVRQDFEEIYSAPVQIRDAEAPLGTHLFTSMHFEQNENVERTAVRWTAITVDNAEGSIDARGALDRVTIPAEARAWIEARLTPDSRLIISDVDGGYETGRGTDFVVQPR